MRIIFESQLYPNELEKEFVSNSKVTLDFAANNFSKAIIEGIQENGQDVRIVNLPNLGSFPSLYKKLWVKGMEIPGGISVGYCNITYLKRKFIKRRLFSTIKNELSKLEKDKDTVLLIYNYLCIPFLKRIKTNYPHIKICMIATDLPEFMVHPKGKLFNIGKKIIGTGKESGGLDLSFVDGFVFLAPRMCEKLKIGNRPWIQMEGIYESGTETGEITKENGKVILYTGNLDNRYGIIKLLDAFSGISGKEYRLWFRGSGNCEKEILNRSKNDDRISLLPPLSRKNLLNLQKKVTVLINPVQPSEIFTHYFFPSKTLEYLASGTPVIMYHLDCIPREYDKYIYYIEEETIEGIRNKIIEVCSKPLSELQEIGRNAKFFIMENKTPKPQMRKVIDFLSKL